MQCKELRAREMFYHGAPEQDYFSMQLQHTICATLTASLRGASASAYVLPHRHQCQITSPWSLVAWASQCSTLLLRWPLVCLKAQYHRSSVYTATGKRCRNGWQIIGLGS